MTEPQDQINAAEKPADDQPEMDTRKPYEAPRVTKKRAVARATLFSPMGTTMTGTGMAV